ncbi:MAG: amidohydrolase [Pseudomonadota bacterium]
MFNRIVWIFHLVLAVAASSAVFASDRLPIIDTHIHYSHDAWERLPPALAVNVLRDAGLKKAFVSSSSDAGTQMLAKEAPDLIVPVLRPYRRRGELGTWMYDASVVDMLGTLLDTHRYAGIGEFHAFGSDIDLPVLQGVIELAKQHRIFLHAHSDADAIDRIFKTDPGAIVLWAHAGFVGPEKVASMLHKHPKLWADLAFRSEHALDGEVDEDWRALFERFPTRVMVGTDTYTPERWYYVQEHASWSRDWMSSLPDELAENLAFRNAQQLLDAVGWQSD